jgi:protein-S-isoprenylcysteine O-methyltransferase Ste14
MIVQSLAGAVFCGLLLFGPAGTLAWPQGWAFLILFFVGGEAPGLWLLRHDPGLLAERMRSPLAGGQSARDRAVMIAILVAFVAWILFMGLDGGRFGWSPTPPWAQVLGAGLMLAAFWGWFTVLRANSFAATTIRVQADRGQTVVSTGPYAVVRHPLYAWTILFLLGAPLLLGSLWAAAAGLLVFLPLLAVRAVGEEALLLERLPGYADYARRVRFRFAPGIW